ncbi:MAG: cupin domain-containing protein [Rhizobacter sp.]|nr:cupin domain-containing protein [Rhizobacter sp.]
MTIKVIHFGKDSGQREQRRLADLPDRVVEGDPHHQSTTFFNNEAGDVIAGTWTSTPGKWHAFTDRDEFCYITAGHVRLIAEDGSAQTFKTGDAFLIPNGFRGCWDVVETTTKHFVIRSYAAK